MSLACTHCGKLILDCPYCGAKRIDEKPARFYEFEKNITRWVDFDGRIKVTPENEEKIVTLYNKFLTELEKLEADDQLLLFQYLRTYNE